MPRFPHSATIATLFALATSCGTLPPARSWWPTADLETTASKSRAEGGQTPRLVPKEGIAWTSRLDGYEARDGGAPRIELTLAFSVAAEFGDTTQIRPLAEYCELVDDEGRRYLCRSALVPDHPFASKPQSLEPRRAEFVLVFPLPEGYRLRAVTTITVHWRLSTGNGEPLAISTSFRA